MILKYPKTGSKWEIQIGPDIPRYVYVVKGNGHGTIVLKHVDSNHCIQIDVNVWMQGTPYNPVLMD